MGAAAAEAATRHLALVRSSPVRPAGHRARPAVARRAPLRLTRRGRVVLGAVIIMAVTVTALVVTFAVSGRAQATNRAQGRAGYQGMREIVVQPGQSLWSIASAAEPTADTRLVVDQIISVNALSNPDIQAGQLLWVPR